MTWLMNSSDLTLHLVCSRIFGIKNNIFENEIISKQYFEYEFSSYLFIIDGLA